MRPDVSKALQEKPAKQIMVDAYSKKVGDNDNRRIAAHHGSSSPQRPEGCAGMRFRTFKWLVLISSN